MKKLMPFLLTLHACLTPPTSPVNPDRDTGSPPDGPLDPPATSNPGSPPSGSPEDTDNTEPPSVPPAADPSPWDLEGYDCITDSTYESMTVWMDNDDSIWFACRYSSGSGLYHRLSDGTIYRYYPNAHIGDVWRSPDDGILYVAGDFIDEDPGDLVRQLFSSPIGYTEATVLHKREVWNRSITPKGYRRTPEGLSIVASTGSEKFLQPSAEEPWTEPSGLWTQFGDMERFDGRIFVVQGQASGSATLFEILGGRGGTPGYTVALQELTRDPTELHDIHADEQGLIITGTTHGRSGSATRGRVFLLTPNGAAWRSVEVSLPAPRSGNQTAIFSACRRGDTVGLVGAYADPGSTDAYALFSVDGGATFVEISPDEPDAARGCAITGPTTMFVVGDGYRGQYVHTDPTSP